MKLLTFGWKFLKDICWGKLIIQDLGNVRYATINTFITFAEIIVQLAHQLNVAEFIFMLQVEC